MIILCVLLICSMLPCYAQNPPDTLWVKSFGYLENDNAYSVQITSDMGYIMAGYITFSETSSKDFWLIKTDSDGNEEWNQYYGGSEEEIARSVIQTDDSGFAVAGLTWSNSAGDNDMWIVKTDSEGNLVWDIQIGGLYVEQAESIQQTADGGYIITGFKTVNYYPPYAKLALIKLDSSGNIEWEKYLGDDDSVSAGYSVLVVENGFVVGGFTTVLGHGHDFWLIKTDSGGNVIWDQTYHYGVDQIREIRQTADNGFILAGTTHAMTGGEQDFLMVKTNSCGDQEWIQAYGSDEFDVTTSVVQNSDEGFIVAGISGISNPDMYDLMLVKIDALGNFVWEYVLESSNQYIAGNSIQTDQSGDCIIAGKIGTNELGSDDVLLVKLANTTNSDDMTVSFINKINNFPNPFNPSTTISFSLQNNSRVDLSIYNVKGQKIKQLISNQLSTGQHSVIWNGTNQSNKQVSSGVYYIKLNNSGDDVLFKKCLLVK